MSFADLGLAPRLAARLEAQGLTDPTPIQTRAIPAALEGRDVLGLAQTGTGKTAAFGLPLIQTLRAEPARPAPTTATALILAPTRELAAQIAAALDGFSGGGGSPRVTLVVGGKSLNTQSKALARGTEILVATPGRLLDLVDRGALTLGATRFLVLDEADQMLDMGFIHALRRIAALLPEARQTMLFSATMPAQMADLAKRYLDDPVRVEVTPTGRTADRVDQSVHYVAKEEKRGLLEELLADHTAERAVVFCRTKHGAERLSKQLAAGGFAAAAIHGNKSQGQRDRALAGFRAGDLTVLVATDVAARGIDIPGVGFVYNFDLPNVPEAYVHRIGRTARAGAAGRAVAFCGPEEMADLAAIERTTGVRLAVASGTPWRGVVADPAPKGRGGTAGPKAGAKPARSRRRRPRRSARAAA